MKRQLDDDGRLGRYEEKAKSLCFKHEQPLCPHPLPHECDSKSQVHVRHILLGN